MEKKGTAVVRREKENKVGGHRANFSLFSSSSFRMWQSGAGVAFGVASLLLLLFLSLRTRAIPSVGPVLVAIVLGFRAVSD